MNWSAIGAILLALAVAFGAFGAHGLRGRLDAYSMDVYERAVFYHFIHAVGLLAVPLFARLNLASDAGAARVCWLLWRDTAKRNQNSRPPSTRYMMRILSGAPAIARSSQCSQARASPWNPALRRAVSVKVESGSCYRDRAAGCPATGRRQARRRSACVAAAGGIESADGQGVHDVP